MSRSLKHLRGGLLGLAFVGTMGFGATQALATPEPSSATSVCVQAVCAAGCIAKGYDGGRCYDGSCSCYRLE